MPATNNSYTEAINSLYVDHHRWLSVWLQRRLGCQATAADFAHDVYMRMLQRRRELPTEGHRPYLATIAKGLLVDHWRRKELEQAWLDTLAHCQPELVPCPESRLLVLETLAWVDKALEQLKPRARDAFLMAQLDGLRVSDIAATLGVSVATIERDLARALLSCYTCLEAS